MAAGSLTLTGANTYSGGTNFNAGTIAVSNDANLGIGSLTFNGGTLEALATGGGIVSSKAIVLNAGGGTFLADNGTISTLSGVISGAGSLTLSGIGETILTGTNTYAGGTIVTGGILQLGNLSTTASIVGAIQVLNGSSPSSGQLNTFNIVNANTSGITSITNTGNGVVDSADTTFHNATTAGSSTITNSNGGETGFVDTSTAGNANIINNSGGITVFLVGSTAGNATITTNSGGITLLRRRKHRRFGELDHQRRGDRRHFGSQRCTRDDGRFDSRRRRLLTRLENVHGGRERYQYNRQRNDQ